MATQFAGITFGQPIESVTFGVASTTKTVEIAYDDAVGLTKDQLRDHIERILMAIEQTRFPAAT